MPVYADGVCENRHRHIIRLKRKSQHLSERSNLNRTESRSVPECCVVDGVSKHIPAELKILCHRDRHGAIFFVRKCKVIDHADGVARKLRYHTVFDVSVVFPRADVDQSWHNVLACRIEIRNEINVDRIRQG